MRSDERLRQGRHQVRRGHDGAGGHERRHGHRDVAGEARACVRGADAVREPPTWRHLHPDVTKRAERAPGEALAVGGVTSTRDEDGAFFEEPLDWRNLLPRDIAGSA